MSDFSHEAIQSYITSNTEGLESTAFMINVFSREEFPKTIRVNTFQPRQNGAAQLDYKARDDHAMGVESLPIGLAAEEFGELSRAWFERLETRVTGGNFVLYDSDTPGFSTSKAVVNAALRYSWTIRGVRIVHTANVIMC